MEGITGGELEVTKPADQDSRRNEAVVSDYPRPAVPNRPILCFASAREKGSEKESPAVDDSGECIWVTSGRIATALGLQHEGIKFGDEVLLPAYYCSSMTDAINAVGATPVFYKCAADLSADMGDVSSKITGRTRALLAVHYFGFPQDMVRIRAFCDEHRLTLVEDCAHAYFGSYRGKRLGSFGDFTITSVMKFFPVSDGGALIFPPGKKSQITLRSAGPGFETKSLVNNVERSVRYQRLRPFTIPLRMVFLLKDWLWIAIKWLFRGLTRRGSDKTARKAEFLGPDSSYGGYGFDRKWMHIRMSGFSRLLVSRLPRGRIIDIRRHNFKRMLDCLADFDNAAPLYNRLPDNVVPYAFPLLVENVEEVFPVLKRDGVPILRWEDIDKTVCGVSSRYSRHLLQFPCHQAITDRELEWMIGRIRSALGRAE